jgi:beta-lactamase regulating signal transducer with metallopeptidase domain
MYAWAGCMLLAASALGLAALLAERAARLRRGPSRGYWLAAMALSILLPIAAPLLPATAPLRLPAIALRLPALRLPAAGTAPVLQPAAQLAPLLWLALSLATLAGLALSAWLLQRRARDWRRTRIGGLEVYVARRSGPAVFGWWRPRIVLPEWLSGAESRQRALALAHEQSHLRARDPQLLACALLLLALMPWNLPLWWQLRRLRCAIEVDCDRRVLGGGGNLVDYCETLIELCQRQAPTAGLMAATSEPLNFLERRIQIMASAPQRWSRLAAGAWMSLAACAVAVAAQVAPGAPANPSFVQGMPALPAAPARPARPAAPAHAAAPARPAAPPRPPAAPDPDEANAPSSPAAAAAQAAKLEAEEAEERAQEAKQEAEETEAEAQEAKRDAEQQAAQALEAKRASERATAQAHERRQAAEAAARALRAEGGTSGAPQ